MISTAIPIAILAAASLASAQATVTPDVNAAVPGSPISVQPAPLVVSAGGQMVAMSAGGQTVTTSNGTKTVSKSSDGQTVTMSNGNKTITTTSGAQSKDELFAGTEKFAQGASESTEINLDPDSMEMVGQKHKTAKKMKTMVIRSYKYDKPGMYKMDDVEVYRKKLEDGSWKCSVRVREKNESTDICSRLAADHETREMVILTAEPKEVTFIHMSGQMSLDELGDAAHTLEHR